MDDPTRHAIEALAAVWQRATTYRGMSDAMAAAVRTELGVPPTADSPVLRRLVYEFIDMASSTDVDGDVYFPEHPSLCRAFLEALDVAERRWRYGAEQLT